MDRLKQTASYESRNWAFQSTRERNRILVVQFNYSLLNGSINFVTKLQLNYNTNKWFVTRYATVPRNESLEFTVADFLFAPVLTSMAIMDAFNDFHVSYTFIIYP